MKIDRYEILGYIILLLLVFGQITVGWLYLVAQGAYLIANLLSVIKDFKQDLPLSLKVKDVCFTGVSLALIVIWTCHY